ncbi:hypothetical protein LB533_05150 [Mesorhizobium sp. BR1-1-13]|uniref:hypothetical protein n=1 Tax=Mesorhizobium sp. BR1-1-13 TaxID=2876656 RepID=UPI001CD109FA|nr:hypothetical protein [Mesorhizobium sp. BR1-1-13]MBZ9940489.1 hypothetical protein [Mesorhizobium sp. BR1-1-13]
MTERHRVGVVLAFVTLAGGGALFAAFDAVAQSAQTCSCLAAAPVSGIVGQFTQVQGDVQMSQAGGYAGVGAGAPIYPLARIMTGPQASASLAVGANCALDVPANATVSIDPVQGGMCVSLDAQQAATGPANSGPGILPVLLGAGAVGGAAALAIGLQDDDDAVSR